MKYKDAIRQARKRANLTQEELSQRLGWRQSRLSNYETGTREPGQSELIDISNALGIGLDQLLGFSEEESNVRHGVNIKGYIPLISWVQAGVWAEAIDLYQIGDAESIHPTTVPHSKNTFALRVDGDSMTAPAGSLGHSFPHGMIIYVDPNQEALPGDYVVAKHNGNGHVTFKKYTTEEGRPVLKPLNTNGQYPIIRDEFEIIGKVIDASWGGL